MSANPFASPKPFVVLLGAAPFTTSAQLAFGKDDITGQYIIGAGPDLTMIQPAAGFRYAAVMQLALQGANRFFRQASFRHRPCAPVYRQAMTQRFQTWRVVTGLASQSA